MNINKDLKIKAPSKTIEDIKESVTILEKVAVIFKTIFELFKSKGNKCKTGKQL